MANQKEHALKSNDFEAVCPGKNRKNGCLKAKGEIVDEVSYSIQRDKKLKSISLCVGNQGRD